MSKQARLFLLLLNIADIWLKDKVEYLSGGAFIRRIVQQMGCSKSRVLSRALSRALPKNCKGYSRP